MPDFTGIINTAKTIYFLGPTGVTPTIMISVDGDTPSAGTGALDEYATGQFSYVLSAAERNGQESIALVAFAGYQTQQFTVETITALATPTNISDAQVAIVNAIADIPIVDISGTLTSYGVATATNVSDSTSTLTGTLSVISGQLDIIQGLIESDLSGDLTILSVGIEYIKTILDNLKTNRRTITFQ